MTDAATANGPDENTDPAAQGEQTGQQEASLEDILAGYKPTPETNPEPSAVTPSSGVALDAEAEERLFEKFQARVETKAKATSDFESVAKKMADKAGLSDSTLAEKTLAGFMVTDDRVMSAWQQRNLGPDQRALWAKVQDGLAQTISAGRSANNVTDLASARASGRTSSGTPPKDVKLDTAAIRKMTNDEFTAFKKGL